MIKKHEIRLKLFKIFYVLFEFELENSLNRFGWICLERLTILQGFRIHLRFPYIFCYITVKLIEVFGISYVTYQNIRLRTQHVYILRPGKIHSQSSDASRCPSVCPSVNCNHDSDRTGLVRKTKIGRNILYYKITHYK